ncbi:MAG: 4-alpha-glucanotransferase [Clostridiales bacterium]|nr:4-alpha-glucanotransferase [Clostridiales bacterium]
MRASGILMPIASLPSPYGIGSFSKCAYDFIDQLKLAGQKYWQILPIGPTGYGDSPYQSFSTFAGNPYFIDLGALVEEGLLTKEECEEWDYGDNPRYIDYEKIYLSRFIILRKAFNRSNISLNKNFIQFKNDNISWLEDYSLYMSIKDYNDGLSWVYWEEDIKLRKNKALDHYKIKLKDDIEFYNYIQFLFVSQWKKLKGYANDNEIKIIGDIPIYVAFDSADTWSNPELFQLDKAQNPIAVSGCPPDGFSEDGQLWGNPLYKWDIHKATEFKWWIERIAYSFILYDFVRIDHFKGFDEYYSIPFGEDTARNGQWVKGPGEDLFKAIKKQLGEQNIIAEDLGYITESVRVLLKKTGFPGMKVLEFGFNSWEDSDYLPHNYVANTVVYTGTHDNDTLLGWLGNMSSEDRKFLLKYLNSNASDNKKICWDIICLAQQSVSDMCIIPIQDYLGLGSEARINVPSTVGLNWKWRLLPGDIDKKLLKEIHKITKVYGRV